MTQSDFENLIEHVKAATPDNTHICIKCTKVNGKITYSYEEKDLA